MILAKNTDAKGYLGISPLLDRGLELLNEEFLSSVPKDTVKLDGDKLFATLNEFDTVPFEDTFFESHKRYLDIHVLLEGEERIDIARPEDLEQFDHKGDFYAYRGTGEQTLILRPGSFLVVFPQDAHRVKMQVKGESHIRKVVFKILAE